MEKGNEATGEMEKAFLALSPEERGAVISYGVALRLSHLKKRLFLAENKIRYFEEKYKTTLPLLERRGLPDDAGFETHEDYLMWRHWVRAFEKAKNDMVALEKIAQQGLYQQGESGNAGC